MSERERSTGEQHLDALVDLAQPRIPAGQLATFKSHVRLIRAELASLDYRRARRHRRPDEDEESRTG